MLMHSPPLPLSVKFSLDSLHLESISLALQYHDRVNSIEISQWSLADPEMLMPLDKPFPMLESLSLHSRSHGIQMLPRNFVAPRLRSLFLLFVHTSAVSSLLINTTNLISLTIALIPSYDHLIPEYLVELISGLPRLENLSISFMPLTLEGWTPSQRTEPTRVVLPNLWRFMYWGINEYLENLLTLISTPLLQHFCTTCYWHRPCTFSRLSEFLGTVQNLHFETAEVSIHATKISLAYHPAQPSASLPYFSFNINETYDDQSQVVSLALICSATAPVLPAVRVLVLKLDKRREISGFSNEQWHVFLRSFGGVRTLQTDVALAAGLSDALHPDHNRTQAEELLPRLSELVVVSNEDVIHGPVMSLIDARRRAGHHLDFRLIKHHPPQSSHSVIHNMFPVF
jgi:hypothetical protein